MKILFDTNAIFSAWLFLNGVCAKSFNKALSIDGCTVVICTQTLQEFLRYMLSKVEIISTPPESEKVIEERR